MIDKSNCGCETSENICPHQMADILASKLNKEEYSELARIIDGDGPAGVFCEAIQNRNEELNPEDYALHTVSNKLIERPKAKPGPTKELTENPQEAANTWPLTTWHGRVVLEDIYKLVEEHLEPLLTEKGWTFQEVYLAYLDPFAAGDENNSFIVGWDVWSDNVGESGFFGAYIQFDVNDNHGELSIKNLDGLQIEGTDSDGFYNFINGAYKHIYNNWGGIIELRLDLQSLV